MLLESFYFVCLASGLALDSLAVLHVDAGTAFSKAVAGSSKEGHTSSC
jgi:hypothetical protein